MADVSQLESFFGAPGQPVASSQAPPTQEQKLFSFDAGHPVEETRGVVDELGRGIGSGIDQNAEALYGMGLIGGQLTGWKGLEDWSRKGAQSEQEQESRTGPQIGSLSQINGTNDFFRYAAGAIGQGLPSIAMSFGTGGIGAAIAKRAFMGNLRGAIVRGAMKEMGEEYAGKITETMMQQAIRSNLAEPAVQRMLANRLAIGSTVGAAESSFTQEAGGSANELDQLGLEAPASALTVGTINAALDAAPVARLMTKFFHGVPQKAARSFVHDMAITMGGQALFEGSTEAMQEVTAMAARAFHDPSYNPLDNQGLLRIGDAAAMGALVGAVTGGGEHAAERVMHSPKEIINHVKNGGQQLREYVARKTTGDLTANGAAEADTAAETNVPGWGEAVSTVANGVKQAYTAAVSGMRERAAEGVDSVLEDAGSAPNEHLNDAVTGAENKLRQRIHPEITKLNARVRDMLDGLRDQAKTLAGSDQVKFIQDGLSKISDVVKGFIAERFPRVTKSVEDEAANRIDTENLPGEEDIGFNDESTIKGDQEKETPPTRLEEAGQLAAEPRTRIGQVVRRQYRVSRTEMSDPVRTRSRGDDAIAFTSREAADKAADQIRATHPEVASESVQVDETKPGEFFVHIYDEGAAEEFFAQQRHLDNIGKSAALARSKDRRTNPRVIEARPPGATKPTQLDLPTLAFGGRDVNERTGGLRQQDNAKSALQGMDTTIARMLTQGWEFPGGMDALADRHVLPGLTVADARRNAQDVNDPNVAAESMIERGSEHGPTAEGKIEGLFSALGDNADKPFTAEPGLDLPSADDQAHESARTTGEKTSRGPHITESRSGNVRVGLLNHSQARRNSVSKLVDSLLNHIGLGDQNLFIVDRQGAEALLKSDQFTEQQKAKIRETLQWDKEGKINGSVMHGGKLNKKRIIFVSNRAFKNDAMLLRTLFHEIGHIVQRVHFDHLSPKLQEKMKSEHAESGSPLAFNEWMADQFVAWTARGEKPQGMIGKFFGGITAALRRMFNAFQQKFHLAGTYKDFIRGVVGAAGNGESLDLNEWGTDILQQGFKNEGVAARPGKMTLDIKDVPDFVDTEQLTTAQARAQVRASLASLKARLTTQFPQAMRHAGSVWNYMQKINDQWATSVNGALRRHNIPAFNELAGMFNKTPGDKLDQPLYFDEVQRKRAEFSGKANAIFEGKSEAEIAAAQAELIRLNGRPGAHTDQLAIQIRAIYDELEDYMRDAGLPMQHVDNYAPKIWDHEKVTNGIVQLQQELINAGVDPAEVDKVVAHMVEHDGAVADFQPNVSSQATLAGQPSNNFIKARSKVLSDPTFDKYLLDDPKHAMTRYVDAAVKRAEFNKLLGDDARGQQPGATWNPRGKYERLMNDAQAQGATQEQLDFANKAVEALLGRYGRDTPDEVRKVMAWIATYQNLRILGFSQLGSLSDILGPAIRTNEYGQAFKILRQQMKEITDKSSNLNEAGRVWGIISDTMNQHILNEHFDTHWYSEGARKVNDKFFRMIGMEKLNNFVRSYSLAVGLDFIERRANAAKGGDASAVQDLAELGLTHEDVHAWVDGGRRAVGSTKPDMATNKPHDVKVAQAMVRFVNEANMRPNPSSRPLKASHPALMLVWHLKSFMFSFYDVFIRQVMLNASRQGVPAKKAAALAIPFALMMAMTAAGLELRELIQYKIWGAAGRTDRMSGSDYLWELLQRSGMLGPSQLAIDYDTQAKRGNLGLIGVAGPTLQQLNDAMTQTPGTTLAKAIPGLNQIPPLRHWLSGQ